MKDSRAKAFANAFLNKSPEVAPPFNVGQDILCLRRSEERDYDGRIMGGCKCTKGVVYTCEGCVWHHEFGWLVVITDEMHAAADFEAVR